MVLLKKIFFIIFNSCFVYILFANLLGLFGVFGESNNWDPQTYYFGFTSLVNALKGLPRFDFSNFVYHLQLAYQYVLGTLVDCITDFIVNGFTPGTSVLFFIWLCSWPITTLLYGVVLIVDILLYLFEVFTWVLQIINGNFNTLIPVTN